MSKKKLYVIFSATPLKMGSVIRTATGERYNHVSLSLCKDLSKMYSFARHYKKAPFYGGFVCETPARYRHKEKIAEVFICALPISEEQYIRLQEKFDKMQQNSNGYCYNLISAATAPISRRVFIKNSFTCAEFAAHIISSVYPEVFDNRFYSIEDLRKILQTFAVYHGPFPKIKNSEIDAEYEQKLPLYKVCSLSLRSGKRVVKSYIKEKIK